MDTTSALQLILPTDKRNPAFTLWQHPSELNIHVYYGLELMEVVPGDPQHAQYKLLVANLYNAGLKVRVLEEVFGVDRKTMKGWGEALRSGNGQRLVQALAGRQARRKLTPEIQSFIEYRFPEVYGRHRRNYNVKLREEVEAVFKVKLSGETIRLVLAPLRPAKDKRSGRRARPALAAAGWPGGLESTVLADRPVALPVLAAATTQGPLGEGVDQFTPTTGAVVGQREEVGSGWVAPSPSPKPASANWFAGFEPWGPGQSRWCDHLGVLLFWNALVQIVVQLPPPEPLLKQWLASVLLGAANVEQTKYLNWDELSLLLGQVVRFPTPQRQALTQVATAARVQALLRWNAQQVAAEEGGDFYLDPHTKHYTGLKPILKGWCPVIRWADKALHSDFVHTSRGEPVYLECTDNFADLRQRVWGVVERARQTLGWAKEKVLTLIIDRAVFGQEVFEKVQSDPYLHLITWEKGYVAGQWQEDKKSGEFVLERARNHAQDLQTYRFKYWDRPWAKDERLRELIVVATNPAGRTIEVAVLTDDRKRSAVAVLTLIFNRWLQENDFRYLEKHFGINQITSYRTVAYAKLGGQVQDRQVKSGQYKALLQQGQQWKRQQQRLLFEQEQADYQHARRQAVITELEKRLIPVSAESSSEPPDGTKPLVRLRLAEQRYEEKRTERRKQIQALNQQLENQQQQLQTVQKEESRLAQLIAQGMHRLDTQNKQLMDAIKITARNLFHQALRPFKKVYDNYRDDHDYFRKLTQAGGVLRWTGQEFEVHLLPQVNYPPLLRKIIKEVLEQANTQQPVLPDGSQRRLRFCLSDRDDFEIRIKGA
jgi:hypothetical protein